MKKKLTPKMISALLVITLAINAAVVAVGLIAGYTMQPCIIIYWMILTAKNIVDYIGQPMQREEKSHG